MRQFALSFVSMTALAVAAFGVLPAAAQTSGPDICSTAKAPSRVRIEACTALIDANPENAALVRALVNRADAYSNHDQNRDTEAFADLERAIKLDPAYGRAFQKRAQVHSFAGKLERALADANEAVRVDPKDAEAFIVRANIFNIGMQKYDRAIEDYNEALRLDPANAQAFSDRGAAYYFKGDNARAVQDYDEAIRLDAKRPRTFSNRSAALKKLGQNDRALADISEAIRLDPTVPEYFDNRGLGYAHNGDYDRAIVDYDAAIAITPKANFLTNRGDSYQFKGEVDRAIADYDAAIKLNPKFASAYNNRGAAFRKQGQLERAIADYEQAIRLNPRLDLAAENRDVLRKELQRLALTSPKQLPTFDCDKTKRAVEKAICSDPQLARLDREIDDAYNAVLRRLDPPAAAKMRRQQREFLATRNKAFGRPEYQVKREMELRLSALR
ncbi:MAG: Tetratricopeptide repeat family protein [Xanthobacteraceae bacterium]|nr:Tetratricopeptide repeat family protein [Xanthobacteraceae bacterium]